MPEHKSTPFLPREHGATAMLPAPMVCAAVLAREWRWTELAAIVAALAALAAKDPMVVLARQRFVWRQPHPETAMAWRWFSGWALLLVVFGLVLLWNWPPKATFALGLGAAAFLTLAVAVNVRNKQRSVLFQILSAAALTSGSIAMSISATGSVSPWCWWLWLLMAMQSSVGILIVHARLDARIGLRGPAAANKSYRRAAAMALAVVACSAMGAAVLERWFVAAGLALILRDTPTTSGGSGIRLACRCR